MVCACVCVCVCVCVSVCALMIAVLHHACANHCNKITMEEVTTCMQGDAECRAIGMIKGVRGMAPMKYATGPIDAASRIYSCQEVMMWRRGI